MLEKIGATLKTANEALSDARKSWRDDNISEREKWLVEREKVVAAREAELAQTMRTLRQMQSKAWFRRVGFGIGTAALVCIAFFAGSMMAQTPLPSPSGPEADSTPALKSNQPSAVPNVESTIEPATSSFGECVARGDAYFKEIGSWPTLSSTGQDAHSAAVERCGRTISAFGPW